MRLIALTFSILLTLPLYANEPERAPGLSSTEVFTAKTNGGIGVVLEPFHAPNQVWSLSFIRISLN